MTPREHIEGIIPQVKDDTLLALAFFSRPDFWQAVSDISYAKVSQ